MVRKTAIIFIVLAVRLLPQEFSVKAYTDTSDYLIGDHIKVYYEVVHDKGISFQTPAFRDSITNIDFVSLSGPDKKEKNGKLITRYVVTLSRFDSADITIPPITFHYWYGEDRERAGFLADKYAEEDTTLKKAASNEVRFRIDAVKVNVQEDIKDIKEPLKVPPDWRLVLLYIISVITLIAAVVYVYRRIKKRREASVKERKIIIPPHVTALTALDNLKERKLWQNGLIKEYHTEVTGIIRKYFEERFGFPALELTSYETLELLSGTDGGNDIREDTQIFLNNADMVKFAKFIPMDSLNEMMLQKAYGIVEKTIPRQPAAEEEMSNVQ